MFSKIKTGNSFEDLIHNFFLISNVIIWSVYWSCIFVDIINLKKSCSQMPSVSTELLKELLRVVKFSVLPYLNFWQKSQTVAYKKKIV